MNLQAREIELNDIPLITAYWLSATPEYLKGMGAEPDRLPSKGEWFSALQRQIETPYTEKQSFGTIWVLDGTPIGHCNLNHIEYGISANMHLHLWNPTHRKKGMGSVLILESLKLFFDTFELDWICCEPYALNPAPHRILEKIGFEFEKEYTTVPGNINFEQPVKRWVMTKTNFERL